MSLLRELADIAEDLLFFGMKPPETPARSFYDAQRNAMTRLLGDATATGGWHADTPIEPRASETADFMWQSIRLLLMARRLQGVEGEVASRIGSAINNRAHVIFDGYCNSTPRWLICQWLLNDPPPAPYWEATILNAISFIDAGARMGGDIGDKMQDAGAQIIGEALVLDPA